tara:strand:+ start:1981 stop:2523 length:543 start_codon:yes stop_codon:yes gene_type:complete
MTELQRQHQAWMAARQRMVPKLELAPAPAPVGRDWLTVSGPYLMADIIKEVCRVFNVRKEILFSQDKQDVVVRARQAAQALSRHLAGASYGLMGRRFKRDHTTVTHSIRKLQPVIDKLALILPPLSPIDRWVEEVLKQQTENDNGNKYRRPKNGAGNSAPTNADIRPARAGEDDAGVGMA